jgi:hypothetical protein
MVGNFRAVRAELRVKLHGFQTGLLFEEAARVFEPGV